ncbi:class C sortase [Clostridium intestinale]|uniref:Sortase family protein n=1 Tax=Clostridium intestinale URNW TaxID=1294142 RepID=U2PX06_9CLOT|nr:class C sortase [Clostridium intestinale]ERK28349.1 sortase family protein [Clostridium intestinale URNW]
MDKKDKNFSTINDYKKNSVFKTIIISIVFILGLGIFSFPIISNLIYKNAAKRVVQNFDEEVNQIEDTEISKKLNLAYSYNEYLFGANNISSLEDPYTQEKLNAGIEEYAKMLKVNEQIGSIIIPKISINDPIYAGTSEVVLQNGIGHLEGTSLPVGGKNTHTVLTGHRGLPTAKFFTELDKLVVGDKFYIKNIGGTIAYEVDQIKVVEPTDFNDLVITPNEDYCTLLTCTPYMINSHRLLVRGHRIEYKEEVLNTEIEVSNTTNKNNKILFASITLVIIVLIYTSSKYIKKRKGLKEKIVFTEDISQEKERLN